MNLTHAMAAGILMSGLSLAQSTQVCSYNLFLLGNQTSSYSDAQGRVAVAGSAAYSGYDFGAQLTPDPTRYDLTVGGTLSFSNGQVEKGSVVAGANIALTNVTIVAGNVVSGGTVTQTNGQIHGTVSQNVFAPLPLDFGAATSFLQSTSAAYGSMIPNGQTVSQWGGLYLTGSDLNLNIFSVSGALLGNVWGIQLTVPAGSSVLINVDGINDKMPNGGFNYQGVSANQVLFNFYQATSLNLGGGSGTILAPLANITFPWGVVNGTVIGNSLTGNGQFNLAPFTGNLPTPPSGGTFCAGGGSGGGHPRQ